MKKKYFIILLLAQMAFSQAPAIQWQNTYGGSNSENPSSIKQTSDGGYVVAGYSVSNDGDVTGNHGGSNDFWIVKISSIGVLQWQKTLGGTADEDLLSIQQTSDGGSIVTGYTGSNDGDVTGNHGGFFDLWVVKISDTGIIQWQKTYGGTGNDWGYSIQQTTDGGYIVAGNTTSNDGDVIGSHGGGDFWVIKISNSGVLLWQQTLGGTNSDSAKSIQQTADGGYIVAGIELSTDGDVIGNHGNNDFWVVKLSSAGSVQWKKTLGGTGLDICNSIIQVADGGYIAEGFTNSNDGDVSGNHGNVDAWIVKLSSTGSVQWQKSLGGTAIDAADSIQQTTDGGFIIACNTTSSNDGDVTGNHGGTDYWVLKLAPDSLSTSYFVSNQIIVFPNPAQSILNLQNPTNITIDKIMVTDLTGKIILEQTQNTNQVNVEKLATGIYILQAFSGEEKFTSKFLKE